MSDDSSLPPSLNAQSISVADLARVLSAAGGRPVSAEQVMTDLESGAPCLPDGRINLIHFTAWLLREVQRR